MCSAVLRNRVSNTNPTAATRKRTPLEQGSARQTESAPAMAQTSSAAVAPRGTQPTLQLEPASLSVRPCRTAVIRCGCVWRLKLQRASRPELPPVMQMPASPVRAAMALGLQHAPTRRPASKPVPVDATARATLETSISMRQPAARVSAVANLCCGCSSLLAQLLHAILEESWSSCQRGPNPLEKTDTCFGAPCFGTLNQKQDRCSLCLQIGPPGC